MKNNTYAIQDAPHIRHSENARNLMGDAIITMLFIYAMAVYYYGPTRVILLCAVSVGSALVSDMLCTLMVGRTPNLRDFSPVVTGMLLPLLMPATVPYPIVIIAAVFAIVVAKHPFGGVGHNVFNPAAAGFSFVAICFGDKLFTYPLPMQVLPAFGPVEVTLVNSPAFTLGLGGLPKYDLIEMALGNYPGPMGATNILVILACLLYLVFRNTVRWEMPVCFFLTVAGMSYLFPRVSESLLPDAGARVQLMLFELMSGILLLGGMYLLGDPVTTPKRSGSKVAFAVSAGVMVVLFQRYGGLEETLPFAILLMNAAVWGFDMLGEKLAGKVRRRSIERSNGEKIQKKA